MPMRRLLVLLATAAVAASVGACGGGDDPEPTNPEVERRQAQAEEKKETEAQNAKTLAEYKRRQRAEVPSEKEVAAKQTATRFYDILAAEEADDNPNRTTIDSTSFCDLMSEEAVKQTIHYAKVSSGIAQEWDCESAVELLAIRAKRAGGADNPRAEVIGINVEGERATATIRLGDGPATSVPLVKEDGEWKLAASPASP